jgi:hypothetical protein
MRFNIQLREREKRQERGERRAGKTFALCTFSHFTRRKRKDRFERRKMK